MHDDGGDLAAIRMNQDLMIVALADNLQKGMILNGGRLGCIGKGSGQ